jgi:hypothetical protein
VQPAATHPDASPSVEHPVLCTAYAKFFLLVAPLLLGGMPAAGSFPTFVTQPS